MLTKASTRVVVTSIFMLLVTTAVPSPTVAGDCTKAENIGKDIWDRFGEWVAAAGCAASAAMAKEDDFDLQKCIDDAKEWSEVLDFAQDFWNGLVGSSSPATIGARDLVLEEWETGTIWGTTARIFISTTPAPAGAKIVVNEEGGKGKAGASICSIKSDGSAKKVKSYTFNDSSSAKSNTNEAFSYTLKNNRVVAIHIDGKSVGNKFRYKVKIVPNP